MLVGPRRSCWRTLRARSPFGSLLFSVEMNFPIMQLIKSLALACALIVSARAEIKTAIYSYGFVHIDVPSGTIIEFLSLQRESVSSDSPAAEIGLLWLPGSNVPSFPYFKVADFTSSAPYKGGIFAGPIRIEIDTKGYKVAATYRLTNATSGLSAAGPSSTVVIPEDATGPVAIILESSTDLVTWTAASPGTYGSSTAKRFFRLRATQY